MATLLYCFLWRSDGDGSGQSKCPILSLRQYLDFGSGWECLGSTFGKVPKDGTLSDMQRYMCLTELRQEEGAVAHCKFCNTNAVRVEGVEALADLDKVTAVMIMDTIDEVSLQALLDM